MKLLQLTKVQLWALTSSIANRPDGFDAAGSRILTKAEMKVDAVLGDYGQQTRQAIDDLDEARQRAMLVRDRDERITLANAAVAQANQRINELDDTAGDDDITLALEDAEYRFLCEQWRSLRNLSGTRKARAINDAVSDALDQARDGTLDADGRVVPVEAGSPTPISRQQRRATERGRR